VGAPTHQ